MSIASLVPIRVHGVLDYAGALLLIVLPLLLDFGRVGIFSIALGVAYIAVSLLTNYPLGVLRVIPIQIHALGDYGVGGILVLGALFFYRDVTPAFWSHLLLGLGLLVVSLVTAYREAGQPAVTS